MKNIFKIKLVLILMLTIYNSNAQQPVNIIWETYAKAREVTFSPNGLSMFTGGLEIQNPWSFGNIKKWDVPSRNLLYSLTSVGSDLVGLTNEIDVSPDGNFFVTGHGDIYCVPPSGGCYNIETGFYVLNADNGGASFSLSNLDGIVTGTSFSSDGNYVAMAMRRTNDPQINVYRLSDYQLNNSFTISNYGAYDIEFSTTNNILAAALWEGNVRIWDIGSNQLLTSLQHGEYTNGGYPVSLDFSPDGTLLASTGDGYNTTIKIWNVSSGDLLYTLEGVPIGSADIAFSPNGLYLAAGFSEYVWGVGWRGIIRIWEVASGILVKEYLDNSAVGNNAIVTSVAFSSIGVNWFVYTYNDYIKFAQTDLDFISSVPVELNSFSARSEDNSVVLIWQTSTETNNKGFHIERKNSQNNEWKNIGFIAGKGTTTEFQNYEFIDENLIEGKYLYRLRQIDYDGSFEYSNEINVEVISPSEFILHQNYPNPFNPSTKIRWQAPTSGHQILRVFDPLGKVVGVLVDEYRNAGSYEVDFDASSLTSGTYYYQLTTGSGTVTKKLVVLK